MARVSERQRIEILMILGYGDKTRTQQKVCNLFYYKYPEQTIAQSTITKIEKNDEMSATSRILTVGCLAYNYEY